ncbi:MAG: hypothetical protein ACO35E_04545 [Ilumatobacteraceae bacterium]
MSVRRFVALVSGITVIAVGCSSGDDPSGTAAVVTTSTPATTTPAATDTVEPAPSEPVTSASEATSSPTTVPSGSSTTVATEVTTTIADTTSTSTVDYPAGIDSLVLRADGVGSLRFGTNIVPVIDTLAVILGEPLSDQAFSYPVSGGPGFTDQFGDFGFVQPFGRQTCFGNELCIEAGGPSPADLVFVGWSQYEAAADTLATGDGVGVGDRWSEHTALIDVDEGGCFAFGTGSIGRIALDLQSSGTMFSAPDGSGGFVTTTPDPGEVTIVGLSAGDLRVSLFADC